MMNKKMEVRYREMDVRNTREHLDSVKRMMQLEESASNQMRITQRMVKEAESKLKELTSKINEVTSRIDEATTTIAEVDTATTVLVDHLDAAQVALQHITTYRQVTAGDAIAMRLGAKKLAQKLTDHKDALAQDLQWSLLAVDPMRITTALNEAIAQIKSARDSTILGLSDMAWSINMESRNEYHCGKSNTLHSNQD